MQVAESTASESAASSAWRDLGVRAFGYDFFISFALTGEGRSTRRYAAALTARLRTSDLAVFYSEEEAAPGTLLSDTLQQSLRRSHALVVVINRGTLQAPRHVRTELETFARAHPERGIVIVELDDALEDLEVANAVAAWLPAAERIRLEDRSPKAVQGAVSDEVVARLRVAARVMRTRRRWRWLVSGVGLVLAGLTVYSFLQAAQARREATAAVAARNAAASAAASEQRAATAARAAASLAQAAEHRASDAADLARTEEARARQAQQEATLARSQAEARLRAAYETQGQRELIEGRAGAAALLLAEAYAMGPPSEALRTMLHRAVTAFDGVLRALPEQVERISAAALTDDGQLLLVGHDSGALVLWDVATGRRLHRMQTAGRVMSIRWQQGMLQASTVSAAGPSHHGERWDLGLGRRIGAAVLDASDEPAAQIGLAKSAIEALTLLHGSPPELLAATSGVRQVVSLGLDNRLIVSSPSQLRELWPTVSERRGARVGFTPDGNALVVVSQYGIPVIVDVATGATRQKGGVPPDVIGLWLAPDARTVVFERPSVWVVWDVFGGRELTRLPQPMQFGHFSPSGTHMAFWSANEADGAELTLRRTADAAVVDTLRLDAAKWGPRFAFADDGTRAIFSGAASLQERRDGQWLAAQAPLRAAAKALEWVAAPGRATAWVAGLVDGSVAFGPAAQAVGAHAQPVVDFCFSRDRQRFVSVASDGEAAVWDAAVQRPERWLRGSPGDVHTLAVSGRPERWLRGPDPRALRCDAAARLVLVGNNTGAVWDTTTGQELLRLPPAFQASDAAISADGRRIAVAGQRGVRMATLGREVRSAHELRALLERVTSTCLDQGMLGRRLVQANGSAVCSAARRQGIR